MSGDKTTKVFVSLMAHDAIATLLVVAVLFALN